MQTIPIDLKIIARVYSEADIRSLQADLDAVAEWCAESSMALNALKCKVMHIGRGNSRTTYSLPNGNFPTNLESTENERDLGIETRRLRDDLIHTNVQDCKSA